MEPTHEFYNDLVPLSNIYYIEAYCYDAKEEFAINTFKITITNTSPVQSFTIPDTILQYNPLLNRGEHFDYALAATQYTDADEDADAGTQNPGVRVGAYDTLDHVVYGELTTDTTTLDFTVKLGMVFGEANAGSVMGVTTYTFEYHDSYMGTPLTDSFDVRVNRTPFQLAAGTNYVFADVDPYCTKCTTYFDKMFPWIVDDYLEFIEIDTSLWWGEIDGDLLTYQLTLSDGRDRPAWMGYTTDTGYFKGYPHVSDSSAFLNLRFTVFDEYLGSHSFHKQILINTDPRVVSSNIIIRVSTKKDFSHSLCKYIYDLDNDYLKWEMTSAADIEELEKNNIHFSNKKCLLTGAPKRVAYHKRMQVLVTDPHGYTERTYFTIIVEEKYYPVRRDSSPKLKD